MCQANLSEAANIIINGSQSNPCLIIFTMYSKLKYYLISCPAESLGGNDFSRYTMVETRTKNIP